MNIFKITRKTHIDTAREQQANQMDEICALLDWSRTKYCWHQFSEYERFCNLITCDCPHLRDKLRYSPVFRGFWNNEWAKRCERDFLPYAADSAFGRAWILDEYLFLNDAVTLIENEQFYIRFEQLLNNI